MKWSLDVESGQIRDGDGWSLATVPHALCGGPSDIANGRLMASAPTLYRACWEALRFLNRSSSPPAGLMAMLQEALDEAKPGD